MDSLFKLVTDYSFITILVVTINILNYLSPVNTKLEIEDSAIAESIDLLEPFKLTTKNMRNNFGFYHTKWYGILAGPVSNVHIIKPKVVIQRICSQ